MRMTTATTPWRSHNWATEWQASHTLNVDWYQCSAAHSQALNGNQKAYAAWHLWARLAGWDGTSVIPTTCTYYRSNYGADHRSDNSTHYHSNNDGNYRTYHSTNHNSDHDPDNHPDHRPDNGADNDTGPYRAGRNC